MHFESSVLVRKTVEQAWKFFENPLSLAKWDRSVAKVIPTSSLPVGVGYTFDTIAPARGSNAQKEGLRMSYRITEYAPNHYSKILLTHSDIFKEAYWTTLVKAAQEGVEVTMQVDLTLRPLYLFMAPVLLLTSKSAFFRDLQYLKHVMEND